WFFGVRGGLLYGIVTLPLDVVLYNLVSAAGVSIISRSSVAGFVMVILVSAAAGAFHDLQEQMRRELVIRQHAEERSNKDRLRLEETVRDRTGKLQEIVAQLQREITERQRAEDKLASERNLLRTLIDHSPDYIFIKDSEGRFIISNLAHARASQAAT